jgi:putative peptidoglycan lipid II flippase
MAPAAIAVALYQVNEVLDVVIASTFIPGTGAVSALYYANRLYLLPMSLVGVALGTAALPALSVASARDDAEAFRDTLARALRIGFFWSLPAAVGLAMLARPLCALLYEHGAFAAESTARAARALAFYAAGLPFYVASSLLSRALYARGKTGTVARWTAAMVGLNLALNLALIGWMAEAGLALATALTGVAQSFGLSVMLERRGVRVLGACAPSVVRSAAAAAVMAAALVAARWIVPFDAPDRLRQAIALAVHVGIAAGLYFAVSTISGRRTTHA